LYVLFAVSLTTGRAVAATIGYWTFDDGAPALAASSIVTPTNSPALNGTARTWAGGTTKPAFSGERGGLRVIDGIGGPRLNWGNRGSLRFVNRDVPDSKTSGAGSVVTVPDNDPLTRPHSFTVEAFVKVDRDVDFPTIVGKNRADAGGTSWQMDINADGTLRVRIDSQALGLGSGNAGFNQSFRTTANLQDGQWHHVAMSYEDTNRAVELYADYVDVGGGTTVNPIVYDGQQLSVGADGGRALDGWVDEVRLSDAVLLPEQFLRWDTNTTPRTVGFWQFDDGTPPAEADRLVCAVSSPALDGTAAAVTDTVPGSKPVFNGLHPGGSVIDGTNGPALHKNSSSLRFVNAALPGDLNRHAGGVVRVTDDASLTRPRDFTAEAFVKIDRRVNWPTIVGKTRAGGTSWVLDLSNNGTFRVRVDSQPPGFGSGTPGFNQGFHTSTNLEDGAWHHVALTYDDNTRAVDLYVDYVRRGGGRTVFPVVYDARVLTIGNDSGGRAFDGWIDEVRLSDFVRHPDELLRAVVPETGTVILAR